VELQVHCPPVQLWPLVQTLPQPPQLVESVWVFTQAPPQRVWPAGQPPPWQRPLTQLWPAPQLFPQPPQLNGSICAFTHAPSQQVSLLPQQFVPWLPLHSVFSHGQTRHRLPQQYWPLGQHVPSQQLSPTAQQVAPWEPRQAVRPPKQP
jgi:hypothetical protein